MEFQHIFEDDMDTDSTSRVVQTNGGTKISTFSTYSTHIVEKKYGYIDQTYRGTTSRSIISIENKGSQPK